MISLAFFMKCLLKSFTIKKNWVFSLFWFVGNFKNICIYPFHCLTHWNYEPYCVEPPRMDQSWWRVLTKHGPLEKGKATHSSILPWRIPWTVYIAHGVTKSWTQLRDFHFTSLPGFSIGCFLSRPFKEWKTFTGRFYLFNCYIPRDATVSGQCKF